MGLDREAVMAEATGPLSTSSNTASNRLCSRNNRATSPTCTRLSSRGCFASGSSGPRFHSVAAFGDGTRHQTVDLRVDLKGRRALIFEVSGDDEIATAW